MGLNRITLIGNIGKDVDFKFLEDGTAMARFPLATSESHKNRAGEKIESTEWHNVVCWGKIAELTRDHGCKGKHVYVEGAYRTRTYDDKDGIKRYFAEVHMQKIEFLGARQEKSPNF